MTDSSTGVPETDNSGKRKAQILKEKAELEAEQRDLAKKCIMAIWSFARLAGERLAYINKNIQIVESGSADSDVVEQMGEFDEKYKNMNTIAEERRKLRIDAVQKEYESQIERTYSETHASTTELLLREHKVEKSPKAISNEEAYPSIKDDIEKIANVKTESPSVSDSGKNLATPLNSNGKFYKIVKIRRRSR